MFQPVKNKKVYELVIEQVQNMIINGDLKIGDRLPSERELAEQMGASRTSIREAIRSLEILGIVESRQGEGNFISNYKGTNWLEPISLMFKLNNGTFEDILEIRDIIEGEAARLAALRITPEQKVELEEILIRLKAADTEEALSQVDRAFHLIISDASHNMLISTMMRAITSILQNFIEEARNAISVWANDPELLLKQHIAIAEAILDGRSEAAANDMHEHFHMVVQSRINANKA